MLFEYSPYEEMDEISQVIWREIDGHFLDQIKTTCQQINKLNVFSVLCHNRVEKPNTRFFPLNSQRLLTVSLNKRQYCSKWVVAMASGWRCVVFAGGKSSQFVILITGLFVLLSADIFLTWQSVITSPPSSSFSAVSLHLVELFFPHLRNVLFYSYSHLFSLSI